MVEYTLQAPDENCCNVSAGQFMQNAKTTVGS